MNQNVKLLELIGLLVGLAAAYITLTVTGGYFYYLIRNVDEDFFAVLFFLLVVGVPAFVSVFIAAVPQSWRFKSVNGTFALFLVTCFLIYDMVRMIDGIWGFVWAMVRLSVTMISALGALSIWRRLKEWVVRRRSAKMGAFQQQALNAPPRTSLPLLILALLSVPFSILTLVIASLITVGFSAVVLMVLLELPRIPIVLLVAAGIAPLAAIWSTGTALKSLLWPEAVHHPAVTIGVPERARLEALVDEVAGRLETEPPEHFLLSFEPVFFVTQSRIASFDGTVSGRILTLGAPLMKRLTTSELKAVLAHEMAHFSGRDTLYSRIVSPVYRGIGTSLNSIRSGGDIEGSLGGLLMLLQLPSIFFLTSFLEFFASIDNLIGRSRELRADWIAAKTYGKQHLIRALELSTVSGAQFYRVINSVVPGDDETLFAAIDAAMCEEAESGKSVLAQAYEAVETEFDTHPSLSSRREALALVDDGMQIERTPAAELVGGELKRLSKQIVIRVPNFQPGTEEEPEGQTAPL